MINDKIFCSGTRWVIYSNGYAGFSWYSDEAEARNALNNLRRNPRNGNLTLCKVKLDVEEVEA